MRGLVCGWARPFFFINPENTTATKPIKLNSHWHKNKPMKAKNFICVLPNGDKITSIVLDQDEFESLADSLHKILSKEQVDRIKEAKHIPMISCGTKTAAIFDKFDIKTNLACFIVRGHGSELLDQFMREKIRNN